MIPKHIEEKIAQEAKIIADAVSVKAKDESLAENINAIVQDSVKIGAQFGYNLDRWIKIESEADLPEESGKYFVCCGNGRNYWAIWYDKSLGKFNTPFAEFSPVTHWQPITPPKD